MSTQISMPSSSSSEFLSPEVKPKVFIKTFGCQMNEYDSEKMYSMLSSTHLAAKSMDEADVIIVNTCSVREKGEHKLFSLLGSLRERKENQPELVVGVSGCVAQQEGQGILKRASAVDFVVGTHNLSLVPSLVHGAVEGRRKAVVVDYREDWEDLPDTPPVTASLDIESSSVTVRALVAIQRGCDKNCSFCVVPRTRGPEVSRQPQEILREVRAKVALGAKEIMLLGQTVNSYGRDLSPRFPFHQLIAAIAEIPGVERIRFTSPHPAEVKKELIDMYGRIPQLCPHIHLPLQSGSDRILQLMNRNYRTLRYRDIVNQLRQQLPEIGISTDIIVGFPTESQGDFDDTLHALTELRFQQVYAFCYSVRPHTEAQRLFSISDQVQPDVASARLRQLLEIQDAISLQDSEKLIGKVLSVLVEGPSSNISSLMRGRAADNRHVEITGGKPLPGQIVPVKVEFAASYGVRGQLLAGGELNPHEQNDRTAPKRVA